MPLSYRFCCEMVVFFERSHPFPKAETNYAAVGDRLFLIKTREQSQT
ncbi:hypothetical protein [Nostoc linckia]|nr:hypothetical protein [Nostoc linckia]